MNSIDKRNNVKTDYDLIAKQYGEEFGNYIEDINIYEEFEKYLKKGTTILDIGAGSGRSYAYFNKKGYNYIAYDFSENMKKCAYELHGEFPYIVDDVVNVKNHFADNSVETVFAIYTLFHLPDEDFEKALKDISDILKTDGIFLLSYCVGNGERFDDEPYLGENGKAVLYMNYMNRDHVNELLAKNNFDILYESTKHEEGENIIGEDGNDAVFVITKKKG